MAFLSTFLLTLTLTVQQATEVNFFHNGKFYSFSLPDINYKPDTLRITDGTFIIYKYETGEIVILHVGGTMVKPFLRAKQYLVTDKIETIDISSRKGYNKRTKLYWQEDIIANGDITLLFENVDKEKVKVFEDCLRSLRVTKVIR